MELEQNSGSGLGMEETSRLGIEQVIKFNRYLLDFMISLAVVFVVELTSKIVCKEETISLHTTLQI